MEWRDDGLIIGLRKHGETSVIAELMTREHGRHLGIVKGGRGKRMQAMLQQGNSVGATWRARLEEHLGLWQLEEQSLRAGIIMESALALAGTGHIGELLRLLPERDPHAQLYDMACAILDHMDDVTLVAQLMVRFELAVLQDLGFGLDFSECAATGERDDLIYVSPKSGRAVSRAAGEPWKDKLLSLPDFLLAARPPGAPVAGPQIAAGFRLSGYFLERDVFGPRLMPLPDGRARFIAAARLG